MDLNIVIDELRKGLKLFRAFEYAEGVAVALQSAVQQHGELTVKVVDLQKQRDELITAVADAQTELDKLKVEAAAVTADAEASTLAADEYAKRVRAEADKAVSDIQGQTVKTVEASLAEAAAKAKAITDEAEAKVAAAEKEHARIQKAIDALRAKIS